MGKIRDCTKLLCVSVFEEEVIGSAVDVEKRSDNVDSVYLFSIRDGGLY